MRRSKGKRLLDIGQRLFQCLAGKPIHQVQVEIVEVSGGDFDGTPRFVIVVNSSQCLEMRGVETLDAE